MNSFPVSLCLQRLDVVWRDARWIMDCLQCVRSKQWVGAVPLGLVMGGDPPARPDGEEEEESLTARLAWPHRLQAQRAMTGTTMTWVQTRQVKLYSSAVFRIEAAEGIKSYMLTSQLNEACVPRFNIFNSWTTF